MCVCGGEEGIVCIGRKVAFRFANSAEKLRFLM